MTSRRGRLWGSLRVERRVGSAGSSSPSKRHQTRSQGERQTQGTGRVAFSLLPAGACPCGDTRKGAGGTARQKGLRKLEGQAIWIPSSQPKVAAAHGAGDPAHGPPALGGTRCPCLKRTHLIRPRVQPGHLLPCHSLTPDCSCPRDSLAPLTKIAVLGRQAYFHSKG